MAIALESLYHDKELRGRMGRAARARVEQAYHWDRLGERLRDVYEQALNISLAQGEPWRHA
jgi:glycosyltransferase involved in cell wall biosynthesis